MNHDFVPNLIGATLDRGRIVVVESIEGGWRGRQRDGRDVVIAFKDIPFTARAQAVFLYEAPGLARVAFFGHPDAGGRWVALAEEKPDGETLAEAGPLDERETVQLGIDLCELALAWSARCEDLTMGLRPETVYVDGKPGARRFTGATPRIELLDGRELDRFEAPTHGFIDYTADDIGFIAARLLWIALLGEDPYQVPGTQSVHDNIWHDRRRPWTGPPALGRLLEQVLVVENRLPVAKFRDALLNLQSER